MMTDDVGDTGHRLTRRTVQAQTEAPKKGRSGFHFWEYRGCSQAVPPG